MKDLVRSTSIKKSPVQSYNLKTDPIPDFKTVQPDTDDEYQLQRVFEEMRSDGKDWELHHTAITYTFEHSVRESAGKEA